MKITLHVGVKQSMRLINLLSQMIKGLEAKENGPQGEEASQAAEDIQAILNPVYQSWRKTRTGQKILREVKDMRNSRETGVS